MTQWPGRSALKDGKEGGMEGRNYWRVTRIPKSWHGPRLPRSRPMQHPLLPDPDHTPSIPSFQCFWDQAVRLTTGTTKCRGQSFHLTELGSTGNAVGQDSKTTDSMLLLRFRCSWVMSLRLLYFFFDNNFHQLWLFHHEEGLRSYSTNAYLRERNFL